ncbi:putative alpha/beta superfamily hydrolase [Metabacillus crassostreae]|uniref:alpha/beta hydrolase n=1 Tax=Metabacillus crassostreae TaxID=929098 RepID=UPI0019583442|nr:alpha/beta hydrolase-fold protein [Metabacillus crassostreae]MBM7605313.1 putative alpha/beta superfamily hydrolase [Metabacillus crassostreae]
MIESFKVHMTQLNQERNIRVYLPRQYNKADKRYQVLYMHDGQNVFQSPDAIGGVSLDLENYLDENDIEIIVVAIDQNSKERVNEYCPWENGVYSREIFGLTETTGGSGKEYVDFVVNDLKPLIDRKYRTKKDSTSIAGISLGGLISTYAACCYPQVFKKVAVLSSAFYRNQEQIEKLLIETDLSFVKGFYIDCGTAEAKKDIRISEAFLASNEKFYHILNKKHHHVIFKKHHDAEHSYNEFKKRVPKMISFIID